MSRKRDWIQAQIDAISEKIEKAEEEFYGPTARADLKAYSKKEKYREEMTGRLKELGYDEKQQQEALKADAVYTTLVQQYEEISNHRMELLHERDRLKAQRNYLIGQRDKKGWFRREWEDRLSSRDRVFFIVLLAAAIVFLIWFVVLPRL